MLHHKIGLIVAIWPFIFFQSSFAMRGGEELTQTSNQETDGSTGDPLKDERRKMADHLLDLALDSNNASESNSHVDSEKIRYPSSDFNPVPDPLMHPSGSSQVAPHMPAPYSGPPSAPMMPPRHAGSPVAPPMAPPHSGWPVAHQHMAPPPHYEQQVYPPQAPQYPAHYAIVPSSSHLSGQPGARHQTQQEFLDELSLPIKSIKNMPTEEYDPIFIGNGQPAPDIHYGNFYPFAKFQLDRGMTQHEMTERYAKANAKLDANLLRQWAQTRPLPSLYDPEKIKRFPIYDPERIKRFLVEPFNNAFGRVYSDHTDIIEILVTATQEEKQKLNCKNISAPLKSARIYAIYKKLLDELCHTQRDPTFREEAQSATQLARSFYDFYSIGRSDMSDDKRWKLELTMIKPVTSPNYSNLRKAFQQYEDTYRRSFLQDIMGMRDGIKHLRHGGDDNRHFLQAVEAVVIEVALGRPYFFAILLREKVGRIFAGTASEDTLRDLVRILMTRAQIDLPDILIAYEQLFRKADFQPNLGPMTVAEKKKHLFESADLKQFFQHYVNEGTSMKEMTLYAYILGHYGRFNEGYWATPASPVY